MHTYTHTHLHTPIIHHLNAGQQIIIIIICDNPLIKPCREGRIATPLPSYGAQKLVSIGNFPAITHNVFWEAINNGPMN
jgi:hypothetical protein